MFAEIRNDFFDEDEDCYHIDAWFTDDDCEPGITIAKVYKDKVEYTDDIYEKSIQVLEVVNETKEYFESEI